MGNNFDKLEWKFIVYKTTNLITNKIYIGVHKTKDETVFDGYIGCGVYVTQPYTYIHAKTNFQYSVKKYGPQNFKRETIAVFQTEQQAYDLESKIVNESFLKRDDVYNMVLGGNGGCLVSQRIKVYQYDLLGNFVQEYTSMAEAALHVNAADYTLISYAVNKKSVAKGFLWSSYKYDKFDLDEYNLGKNHRKEISVYDINGVYIETCESIAKTARKYCVSPDLISKSCMLGCCANNKNYFCYLKSDLYDNAYAKYLETRPIYKYSSTSKCLVSEYSTLHEATKLNPEVNISEIIDSNMTDINGFFWSSKKTTLFGIKDARKRKNVGKFDLNGNLIFMYSSASKAANENGTSVWKALYGINLTHKGFVYKFI